MVDTSPNITQIMGLDQLTTCSLGSNMWFHMIPVQPTVSVALFLGEHDFTPPRNNVLCYRYPVVYSGHLKHYGVCTRNDGLVGWSWVKMPAKIFSPSPALLSGKYCSTLTPCFPLVNKRKYLTLSVEKTLLRAIFLWLGVAVESVGFPPSSSKNSCTDVLTSCRQLYSFSSPAILICVSCRTTLYVVLCGASTRSTHEVLVCARLEGYNKRAVNFHSVSCRVLQYSPSTLAPRAVSCDPCFTP